MAYISYAETWSLNVQIDGCANDWEKSCSIKLVDHIPCGYYLSIWSYRKQAYFLSWGKFYEKDLQLFKGACYKYT